MYRRVYFKTTLFSIDMIDFFDEYEIYDFANCDDDATSYSCAANISSVRLKLQVCTKLFNWLKSNDLKVYPRKSHIFLSTKKQEMTSIDRISFVASSYKNLFVVAIHCKLKVENDITELCVKEGKKM